MEQYIEIPAEAPIFHKFHLEYLDKILSTKITCPKCGNIPFMKITSPEPLVKINFKCLCSNNYSIPILEFFNIHNISEIITQRFLFMGKTLGSVENDKLYLKEKQLMLTDIFQLWDYFLQSHKIVDLLNIKIQKSCALHENNLYTFFCKDCNNHLCCFCKDIHDRLHCVIELESYLDKSLLNQKIKLFPAIKKIRLEENLSILESNEKIIIRAVAELKDKINLQSLQKIALIISNKNSLTSLYNYSYQVNGCMFRFFNLMVELCYSIKTPSNFILLENLKENWNFCLDEFLLYKDFSENVPELRCKEVGLYFISHLLIQPIQSEYEDYMEVYEKMNKVNINKIREIELIHSRQYGQHVVKINHILLLKNKTIAICSDHPVIKIYNQRTLRTEMKFKGHKGPVNYMCNVGNDYFASCSDDQTIIIWENKKATFHFELSLKLSSAFSNKTVLKKHTGKVIQVISINDNEFASCSTDKSIIIWKKEKVVSEFTSFTEPDSVFIAMTNTKNKMITVSEDKKVRFWNFKLLSMEKEKTISNVNCLGTNCFKVLNNNILLSGEENGITVIDIDKGKIIQYVRIDFLLDVYSIWVMDNSCILCGCRQYFAQFKFSFERLSYIMKKSIEHTDRVTAITGNDTEFYSVGHDSLIKSWSIYYK